MVELLMFILGGLAGFMLARSRKKEVIEPLETPVVETEAVAVSKPDNRAVRYYSSPEYRRQKAFLDDEARKRKKKRTGMMKIDYD